MTVHAMRFRYDAGCRPTMPGWRQAGFLTWGAVALKLALILAPILCKRLADGVGMFLSMHDSERAVTGQFKNVDIRNLSEKHLIDYPIRMDVPVMERDRPGRSKSFLGFDGLYRKRFVSNDLAYGHSVEYCFVSASAPFNLCDEARGPAKVVNPNSPWPVEICSLGSVTRSKCVDTVIGFPEQSAAQNVSTLMSSSHGFLTQGHPNQTSGDNYKKAGNNGKDSSKDRDDGLIKLFTQRVVEPFAIAAIGFLIAVGGILLQIFGNSIAIRLAGSVLIVAGPMGVLIGMWVWVLWLV